MRLTLVISSLGSGGAERSVSRISNYWANRGWEISILTFDKQGTKPFYELHPSIMHSQLDISKKGLTFFSKITKNIVRLHILRKSIKKTNPDVVISFIDQTNVLTIIATLFFSLPVIITEHIDPKYHSIGIIWDCLRRLTYPFATSLVTVSNGVMNYFPPKIRKKGFVIPNPINIDENDTIKNKKTNNSEKTIISIGRLDIQKGFDLLIQAFNIIKDKHPQWHLKIFGEGPMRNELEKLADSLHINDKVSLPGVTKQPFDKLRNSDIFVLSSRYEGFGIVLCEAMACGLPVISFDCPSGPCEIIDNGVNGILVPPEDVHSLAMAMDRLINDECERMRLASRATEILNRFGTKTVIKMWDKVLEKIRVHKRTYL